MCAAPTFSEDRFDIIAIGASTGAPQELERIFQQLPADLPVPILVGQHMPATFTPHFSVQLDRHSPVAVVHAEEGQPLLPGVGYVGQGGLHMRVRRRVGRVSIEINSHPKDLLYKPSADEIFTSCANVYGKGVLAVVMTGLGSDGCKGAQKVVEAGGVVITQSKDSCVVYGMPKACDDAGLSSASLDPDGIAATIRQLSPTCSMQSDKSA